MLKYIELKSGFNDNGPAWIARVKISKSGRTIYFNGMALKRAVGGMISGNYYNMDSGDEYWITGVKKRGTNRHWAGSGRIIVEAASVQELLTELNVCSLDPKQFVVSDAICPTDPLDFVDRHNIKLSGLYSG
jgi:hypothetical protein